jgi:hypothetical protein
MGVSRRIKAKIDYSDLSHRAFALLSRAFTTIYATGLPFRAGEVCSHGLLCASHG